MKTLNLIWAALVISACGAGTSESVPPEVATSGDEARAAATPTPGAQGETNAHGFPAGLIGRWTSEDGAQAVTVDAETATYEEPEYQRSWIARITRYDPEGGYLVGDVFRMLSEGNDVSSMLPGADAPKLLLLLRFRSLSADAVELELTGGKGMVSEPDLERAIAEPGVWRPFSRSAGQTSP